MTRKSKMITVQPDQNYRDENGNEIIWRGREAVHSKVMFGAKNCTLIIDENAVLRNATIRLVCDGGLVHIGEWSTFKGVMSIGLNSRITIGRKLTVTDSCSITAAEGSTVDIGDDCMFAKDNVIMADDHHPIFDLKTGKRVNPSRSIVIGNHVWLALRAAILSGSHVGDGAVVGFGSVVKGRVPASCIAAGVPAKVVRRGVHWEKHSLFSTPPYEFPSPMTFVPEAEPESRVKRLSKWLRDIRYAALRFQR